jgi:hypothetical protein
MEYLHANAVRLAEVRRALKHVSSGRKNQCAADGASGRIWSFNSTTDGGFGTARDRGSLETMPF